MIKKINKIYAIAAISLLLVFHSFNNMRILEKDTVPLFFDEGGFYNISINYYKYFVSSAGIRDSLSHLKALSEFYPPLFFLARIPFYSLFGSSQDVSVLANLFFLCIAIYFVFLLGRRIYNGRVGMLAAFLFSFYPGVYGFSRTNFMETEITALLAMSAYFLLRTDNFCIRRYAFLFASVAGLGLLTKQTYIIYVMPLFLCQVFESFRKTKDRRIVFFNLFLALSVCLGISMPWYWPKIKGVVLMAHQALYSHPNWGSMLRNPFNPGFLRYLTLFEVYHLFSFYTLLFIYALFRYIFSPGSFLKNFLLWAFFVPYVIFTVLVIEFYSGELCPRYAIPLLIFVSIISARGALEIRNGFIRTAIVVVIVVIGLAQFFYLGASQGRDFVYAREDFQLRTTSGMLSPKAVDWKIEEIANVIRDHRAYGKRLNVLVIPHNPLSSALVYNLQSDRNINLLFPLNAEFVNGEYVIKKEEEYDSLFEEADIILFQEGGKLSYDESPWVLNKMSAITERFEMRRKSDKQLQILKESEIAMDGGIRSQVYRKAPKATHGYGGGG